MLNKILFFACIIYFALAADVYTNCPSTTTYATIGSLEFENCIQSPCPIKKGQSYDITLIYTTSVISHSYTLNYIAKLLGIQVGSGSMEVPCSYCPTVAGGTYTQNMTFPALDPTTLSAKYNIQIKVPNEAGQLLICINMVFDVQD